MKLIYGATIIILFYILLLSSTNSSVLGISNGSDTLKAQIDITILSGSDERYSKPFDKVRAGEKFHIHIKPENKNYLWIINVSNGKTTVIIDTLLNNKGFYVFPSKKKFFVFDGKSDIEKIIVILAFNNEPQSKINNLLDKDLLSYIQKLDEKSKCNISEKGDELINISGNLRDISSNEQRMSKYQGIHYLIKEYQFNVKK
jgi:hypothetical protein